MQMQKGRTYESHYNKKMKFISKGNMKIGKISNVAEYRMDEQFQNLLIFGILRTFQIKKKI